LWEREEANVQEVRDALEDLGRALQPTSVATVLNRLAKRDLVARRLDGRQYMYSALRSEATVRRSALTRVKELVFGGDLKAMVAHLLDPNEVEADELAQVRRLISEHDARRALVESRGSIGSIGSTGSIETTSPPRRSKGDRAKAPSVGGSMVSNDESEVGAPASRRSKRED